MPKVTLHYFDIKGLGEPLRLLLKYFDVEFEDHRITKEEWPAIKPSMPFGTLPILEIDGKIYAQSQAIGRFLGHKYGLAGKNIEEDFEIDQILGFMNDISMKASIVFYENDEELKKQKHEALAKEFYPKVLEKLNEVILKNNGHLALGRLTWADFMLGGMIDGWKTVLQIPDMEEKYPGIKKLLENVYNSSPKVKAYCEKTA